MSRRRSMSVVLSLALAIPLAALAPAAQAAPSRDGNRLTRSAQLSASARLADRRSFVIGNRFYEVGAEDGSYPGEGFHTRGEMGGFWSMPIKLLDGVWFGVDGSWLKAGGTAPAGATPAWISARTTAWPSAAPTWRPTACGPGSSA
jgi:hypothetical protein